MANVQIVQAVLTNVKIIDGNVHVSFDHDFITYKGGTGRSPYRSGIEMYLLRQGIEYMPKIHSDLAITLALESYIGTTITVRNIIGDDELSKSVRYNLPGLADILYDMSAVSMTAKEKYANLIRRAEKLGL